jgi:hypothetical protein
VELEIAIACGLANVTVKFADTLSPPLSLAFTVKL